MGCPAGLRKIFRRGIFPGMKVTLREDGASEAGAAKETVVELPCRPMAGDLIDFGEGWVWWVYAVRFEPLGRPESSWEAVALVRLSRDRPV